jgi:hypothetical protein
VVGFKDTKAESVTLTAQLNDQPATAQSKTFTFAPPAPVCGDPDHISLTIERDRQPADGVSQNQGRAHVSSTQGNALCAAALVRIFLPPFMGATFDDGSREKWVPTDENDDVVIPFTDITAETIPLSVQLADRSPSVPGNADGKNFTFVPPRPVCGGPDKIGLTIERDRQPADGISQNQGRAHVWSTQGSTLCAAATVRLLLPSNATATFDDHSKEKRVTTDQNGDVEALFTDTRAETVALTARLEGPSPGDADEKNFTFLTPVKVHDINKTDTSCGPWGGMLYCTVTLEVVDAKGSAIPNVYVDLSVSGPSAFLDSDPRMLSSDPSGLIQPVIGFPSGGGTTLTTKVGNYFSKDFGVRQ